MEYNTVTVIDFGNGGSVHSGYNNSGYTYYGGSLYMEKDFQGQNVTDPEKRKHRIDAEVFRVLDKTKFPSASGLVSNLQLKNHFYDLTWEDLKDEELLDWFKLNDLISKDFNSELASVKNAYEEWR